MLQFDLQNVAESILQPFQKFFKREASSGIFLMLATVAAMIIANSPLNHLYHALWETPVSLSIGEFNLELSLHHWINDGLMAIFFFLVGLEIKREVLAGELSSISSAVLPIAAALGGMVMPAGIYMLFNYNGPGSSGWGIPMATDIAFALGILALLGKRIPSSLLVFLTALAIADDLGAILVIAIFYTEQISTPAIIGATGLLFLSFILNRIGVRNTLPYVLLGIFLWLLLLRSGIHATVAGVLLAMTIPVTRVIRHNEFVKEVQKQLYYMTGEKKSSDYRLIELDHGEEQAIIVALEEACHKAEAPLQHIEQHLHPWVVYLIIPLFAFANAGIMITTKDIGVSLLNPVTVGIILGLFTGKMVGIFSFTLILVKSGLAQLPEGIRWGHIFGVSILGGIGFTMSLFIGNLAFQDPLLLSKAKLGIFIASILSGITGYLVLRCITSRASA